MLFNSYEFLIFLACVLVGFYLALRGEPRGAANWLPARRLGILLRLVGHAKVVLLLFGSVLINYLLGMVIAGQVRRGPAPRLPLDSRHRGSTWP